MESADTQPRDLLAFKSPKPERFMDWRPEGIRIMAIFYIVLGHMLLYTDYLTNDARNPLVWIAGVAIAFFIACSGYVHSLKDEFNKPGSLSLSRYWKFIKNRILHLYIGYYIALVVILIAKGCAGYTIIYDPSKLVFGATNPIVISPGSLVLDLTCMWPLVTGLLGGIWPEGWFVCAIMILSLAYPFLRRLNSMNKNYMYFIIIVAVVCTILVIFFSNPYYAYHFPFAWTAEFSLGIMLGNKICMKGGPAPPTALYKQIIIRMATRVWPIYLFHIAAIVFMPPFASLQDFIITIIVIVILVEFFVRILHDINDLIGGKKKKNHRTG